MAFSKLPDLLSHKTAHVFTCAVLGFAIAIGTSQSAELSVSAGLAGSTPLKPFLEGHADGQWSAEDWTFDGRFDGRLQHDAGLGDADVLVELGGKNAVSGSTLIALDADYAFERDFDEAIKHVHRLGFDAGLEHDFGSVVLTTDAGVDLRLHEPTTQKGFSPLLRKKEDFYQPEAAMRLTFSGDAVLQPFVEAAYLRRNYFIDAGRDFSGFEVIAGATFNAKGFTGDAGLILANRKGDQGNAAHIIGPYVDLKWLATASTEMTLALSSGIDQETSGSAELFKVFAARTEAVHHLNETVRLSAALDVIVEDRDLGRDYEFTPNLKIDWTVHDNMMLFSSAGLVIEKDAGESWLEDRQVELGLKLSWQP